MARTWITVTVELVSGMGEYYWPRPGRVLLAKRSTSFRELARAIDAAFGRWDLGHLHQFSLSDGSDVVPLDWWEDATGDELDDAHTSVARLNPGEAFAYEFDLGDAWEHVCTVGPDRVDPAEVYGSVPTAPVVVDSWGTVPDQYGRRWREDDGEAEPPAAPDPPAGDLPPLMPGWGGPDAEDVNRRFSTAGQSFEWEPRAWDDAAWRALRAAVYQRNAEAVIEALRGRDLIEVAHLAGEGVLLALQDGSESAVRYALVLIRRLAQRGGPGDEALVDELRAAMGQPDTTGRRPLPIDLEELAALLHGGDSLDGWRIDRDSARWWPDDPEGTIGEPPPAHWDDEDRWLEIHPLGPQVDREDMNDFIQTVDDPRVADELREALSGRGGFGRFRGAVRREDVGRRWQRFENERQRGRAREWLAEQGYRPVAPTP